MKNRKIFCKSGPGVFGSSSYSGLVILLSRTTLLTLVCCVLGDSVNSSEVDECPPQKKPKLSAAVNQDMIAVSWRHDCS